MNMVNHSIGFIIIYEFERMYGDATHYLINIEKFVVLQKKILESVTWVRYFEMT